MATLLSPFASTALSLSLSRSLLVSLSLHRPSYGSHWPFVRLGRDGRALRVGGDPGGTPEARHDEQERPGVPARREERSRGAVEPPAGA